MRAKSSNAQGQQPLDRTIALLDALAAAARPTSVTELAAMCNLPVPSLHRLAAQLERRSLVKRALGTRKLLVGPELVRLGLAAAEASLRSDRVHQILVALADEIGEPCQIGIRANDDVVYVDSTRAARSAGLHFEQGRRAPLHCASIGKIYLAEVSPQELDQWLASAELRRFTPHTIVSKPELRSVVRAVRKDAWAASNEEFVQGVVGCAVPIRFASGKLVAGLGMSVPSARTPFAKIKAFVAPLNGAARKIAATLGY